MLFLPMKTQLENYDDDDDDVLTVHLSIAIEIKFPLTAMVHMNCLIPNISLYYFMNMSFIIVLQASI